MAVVNRQGAGHWPQLADNVAWKAPTFNGFFLDLAAEKILILFVKQNGLSDNQLHFVGGFVIQFRKLQDIPNASLIGGWKCFQIVPGVNR